MITVPALGDQGSPHLDDRLAERVGPRPAPDQLFSVAGDQEQAIVRPGSKEDHDHEDIRDVDHPESFRPGIRVKSAIDFSEVAADSAIVMSGIRASTGER